MIEVREPNFVVDLPGEWEAHPGAEPSSTMFIQTDGLGVLNVLLLSVRPMFAIADQQKLLEDYLQHRSTFESGSAETVITSEFATQQVGDDLEGVWLGLDVADDRRIRHRVILTQGLLVDFAYENTAADPAEFSARAGAILSSARAYYNPELGAPAEDIAEEPDAPEADDAAEE